MPSQFFGLTIGYSGLTAYQAALETTGNNISNVETKGYSRQRINQQASNALRTYTTYGMAGAGTTVTSIEQVRNAYYDIKYRNATTSLGEYDTKADYMKQIENYFNDDGVTILGFASISDNFYKALEDVQNNPGDVATRTTFVGQAKALCEYFNSMAENLEKLQLDANDQIKNDVDQINKIAEQISTLNKQINIIELRGSKANELRDQRNNLVDELAKYVDVDIIESPIYNTDELDEKGNPKGEPSGAFRYTVTISGNQTLVDGYEYRTLECVAKAVGDKTNQSDAEGLYDIRWTDTEMYYYPIGTAYSGELKGLLQVRDGNNGENFRGVIKSLTNPGSDNVKVTISTSAEYLQDIMKTTLNGSGTIKLNGAEYDFSAWEYDRATGDYTFTLKPDAEQGNNKPSLLTLTDSTSRYYIGPANTKKAAIGTDIDYQGIPYYQEQLNEWVRNFARVFNNTEELGEDTHGDKLCAVSDATGSTVTGKPRAFFVAENITDGDNPYVFSDQCKAVYTDGTGTKTEYEMYKVTSTSDSYYMMTASAFSVNDDILKDASKMSTTDTQGNINLDANDIIDKLEKIRTDKSMMEFRGCSSSEFLNCILGDVALNANSANTFEANFTNIQNSVTQQRLSVSGVDDDEEALNLVKYQNAYNLSAKMIQVMTEIYDKLIEQTGV